MDELGDEVWRQLEDELSPSPVCAVLEPDDAMAFQIADYLRTGLTAEKSAVYVAGHPGAFASNVGDVWVACVRPSPAYNVAAAIQRLAAASEHAVFVAYGDAAQLESGQLYDLNADYHVSVDELSEALPEIMRAVTWRRRHLIAHVHRARLRTRIERQLGLNAVKYAGMEPRQPDVRPLTEIEAEAILGALQAAGGSKADAAQMLGVARATIYRKLRAHGLLGHSDDGD